MSEETKTKKSKGNIPRAEADFITVATTVAKSWEKHPELTLIWTKSAALKEAIEMFKASFLERKKLKGSRVVITKTLSEINAEINQSVGHVKNYLIELYSKKNAPTYYAQCGIVKQNGTYKMPNDNDDRLHSLGQMVEAISLHGLDDRKYGKQYWEDIRNRFSQAKEQASDSDSSSSEHVSVKSGQKSLIRETLNALISLLKANYPDNWRDELRKWGFQKEKY